MTDTRAKLADKLPKNDHRIDTLYARIVGDLGGEVNLTASECDYARTLARAVIVADDVDPHASGKSLQFYTSLLNTIHRFYRTLNLVSANADKEEDEQYSNGDVQSLDDYLTSLTQHD